MTLRVSGILLVARHINSDPERGAAEIYEWRIRFFFCKILRREPNLDRSWPDPFGRSVLSRQECFAQYFRDGRKHIAHAARNYRLYLKSGDSYLFREEERSRGFGGRSINYFSLPSFLSFDSLFGTCLKNPLSLWPRRNGRVSAYVFIINHAFSSQLVYV